MVVKEFYKTRKDGVKLFRNYSDKGFLIVQNETGIKYAEAIDIENAPYTYTETDEKVDFVDVTEDDYKSALNELGVETDE